ncbi:three-Cys-motif partner protein TcmP [Rhizobium leguminosarum]|uniref:three-Cys-motif partner protein TcmP n=1 Tax=Rhizobium leguminosarum TaxID=384 RepID=UPI00103D0F66|nr:three-Cys-motif partner protein TcmP [Rhizobium leguminosarum]TBY35704.1 three-Cys-motif partner protein TcmP [Rhizobium leguminosarum bv. viciae]
MAKQTELFPSAPKHLSPLKMRRDAEHKVWTENKAQLIARYLRYFVFITKHGAYIDGFAAPKDPSNPQSWAAKLVVESEPKFLRQFFWCELEPDRAKYLEELAASQPPVKPSRRHEVLVGDFNKSIDQILAGGVITDKTATFCLLDQYTCECEWATLEKLASHKAPGHNKIELFYFLAVGWMPRTLAGFTKNVDVPERCWGRDDWKSLQSLGPTKLQLKFEERFRKDLGYRNVYSFPIYEHDRGSGKQMFTMIHASDHDEAPRLMQRAYRNVMKPLESEEQLAFELGGKPPVMV